MAMTPEERKAYAKEYYEKYRKKGLKKGRKRGKGKVATKKSKAKVKTENIVGVSSSGLNEAGAVQFALAKDKLKKEMNEALTNETDPTKREAIKREYHQKMLAESQKLKSDPQYAKAKAQSKTSGAKANKTSNKSKGKKSKKKKTKDVVVEVPQSQPQTPDPGSETLELHIQQMNEKLDKLEEKIMSMTDEEKAKVKLEVEDLLAELKKARNKDENQ